MDNIQPILTIIFICIKVWETFGPMNNLKFLKQYEIYKKIVIKSTLAFSQIVRMQTLKSNMISLVLNDHLMTFLNCTLTSKCKPFKLSDFFKLIILS